MGQSTDRQALENQMEKEGRLPPGQSLTYKFPVLHYGSIPVFNPENWRFKIWGEVKQEITWTWEEFSQLPQTEIQLDIHCVTRWSKFDTLWKGISLQSLIEFGVFQLNSGAAFVLQHAEGGYTTNLPLEIVLQENFLLATHFDGEPLTPEHGAPVRGMVGHIPGSEINTPYFWKGAKWLIGLEFLTEDQLGFWEKAGYHNEGDIWQEQRTR
ncbi:MAG: molybdopterin-dependent oxidoreductase [Anaerolineales bacterium]|nr:molybdopterin-dependent oxidoreductase [Anaerolineales bacterium]